MTDIKQFLYAYLGKLHKVPNYEWETVNAKNRARFKCIVNFITINIYK
jgi:hypothetical protein